jgi:hypothetical protein
MAGWTAFFLEGVATIAEEAVQSARELFGLVSRDRTRVLAAGKASVVAARLFEELPRHPVVDRPRRVPKLDPLWRPPRAGLDRAPVNCGRASKLVCAGSDCYGVMNSFRFRRHPYMIPMDPDLRGSATNTHA